MDDEPADAAEDPAAGQGTDVPGEGDHPPVAADAETDGELTDGELIDAEGTERHTAEREVAAGDEAPVDEMNPEGLDEDDDFGYPDADDEPVGGRRNALPRRVESWRSRSATGAIATAMALGLQQVFEPERRRPAAMAEAPSDPYSEDDPITVDYVPDDAESTTVHVKPWLLQKGE